MSKTSYSDETISAGLRLRESGATWKEIAKELGGTEHSWRGLIKRREPSINSREGDAYTLGAAARTRKKPKAACPYPAHTRDWAWWLGGWNDCDMGLSA